MNGLDAEIAAQPEAHFRGCMFFLSSQFTAFSRMGYREDVLEEGKGMNIRKNPFILIILGG